MNISNINQLLIGRLNSTNDSYTVGNIDGLNFISCAIGADLVILTEKFKEIQLITLNKLITILSACSESGKIAACCDRSIRIFEPILQTNLQCCQLFPYYWIETQKWDMNSKVDHIQWILDGFRLLIFADKDLILYQHKVLSCAVNINRLGSNSGNVKFTLNPAEDECIWELIWSTKLASKIKHVRFSQDSTLFATCGENDSFVKIWYQLKDSQSFSFIYIQHPAPVSCFEWRRSGSHLMPRRMVHNALITCCEDNTARIWKEIPSNEPNLELHFINAVQNAIVLQQEKENSTKPKKSNNSHRVALQMRKAKSRLVHKLTHMINEKKKVSIVTNPDCASSTNADMVRSSTFADFSIPAYTPGDTLVFCLVATISAENDCYLVPSMSSSHIESESKNIKQKLPTRPFMVHWLNNKEYEFEMGAHRILTETSFLTEKNETKDISQCQMLPVHSLHSSNSSAGLTAEITQQSTQLPHPVTTPNLTKTTNYAIEHNTDNPSTNKDLLDFKLEKLVCQWGKSCDILFTIHPLDGSLLTWTLEWLDDNWKQPVVSFTSRIPDAFPIADAISLSTSVNTIRPSFHHLYEQILPNKIDGSDDTAQCNQELQYTIMTRNKFISENNEIYLLTGHDNGSLNLWRLQIEMANIDGTTTSYSSKESASRNVSIITTMSVINVIHGYRMCQPINELSALEILKNEGLFDASCLSNPLLPQYHPIQLVGMLNAGKIQRVKAILLNVLRALRFRQPSDSLVKSFGRSGGSATKQRVNESTDFDADPQQYQQRRNSISAMSPLDISELEYDVMDVITPLPLYALLATDSTKVMESEMTRDRKMHRRDNEEETSAYDMLFSQSAVEDDLELTIDFETHLQDRKNSLTSHGRKISIGSLNEPNLMSSPNPNYTPPTKFTAKHSRFLTEMLTHTHLNGLTSVDQMHLLAVADTLSHFSNSIVDRLAQANAALQPAIMSSMGDTSASGYANAATGMETVDECGLRFLMAKKQHEYLLRCLPLKQRRQLRSKGIPTAYVIWAFHSDTEMELLNSIPCFQRQQENWDELRSYGIAWWLRNNATLRICIERVAKNAFQKDQNPLDAALFYLAMKKKNVLTQLFKTVNDTRMYEFFREDFTEEKWKKAALKNAFILMSKQRFYHAAAFFLLGGSLKDAVQTILHRIHDLQLGIVILRLYEMDPEKQLELLTELLCKEVLVCDITHIRKLEDDVYEPTNKITFPDSKSDPFERSMSLWIMKQYVLSAETLLEEASTTETDVSLSENEEDRKHAEKENHERSFPNIFNFYAFLRRHPLVIRQKLARARINTTTTEQFLTWTRKIGAKLSESEKRLYVRTAKDHLLAGCPILALDVLSSLPEELNLEQEQHEQITPPQIDNKKQGLDNEVDWSTSITHIKEEKLELDWGDDDTDKDKEKDHEKQKATELTPDIPIEGSEKSVAIVKCPPEFQHLKLLSTLSIIADELNTLASGGYEIAGGQLRLELFSWLEKECEMVRKICIPVLGEAEDKLSIDENEFCTTSTDDLNSFSSSSIELPPLHEVLQQDRMELREIFRHVSRRRNWLTKYQKLLHTLAAYCALQCSQNNRLISIQMELLLLILEVQRNEKEELQHFNEPIPDIHSFPLLVSSLSPNANSPISPLRFIMDQCANLLTVINEIEKIPQMDNDIPTVTKLFNLSQGLSFCVYQSLSNIENLYASSARFTGPLTQRIRRRSSAVLTASDELQVQSLPNHWPGVNALIALITRERILDESTPPNLRLLLVEFFISIFISIFYYSFALYDSRLLYRLSAHGVDSKMFGEIFGGGGERHLRSAVPVRPPPPKIESRQEKDKSSLQLINQNEVAAMRAKLHAKVFTTSNKTIGNQSKTTTQPQCSSEQIIQTWISPRKHIVQYFIEKVPIEQQITPVTSSDFYDSDQESIAENDDQINSEADYFKFQDGEFQEDSSIKKLQVLPHDSPDGYAWTLLRLVILRHICAKIEHFIEIAGFDFREVARTFPKLEQVIRRLNCWAIQLEDKLEAEPDGCPSNFLPNMHIQESPEFKQGTLLQKYNALIEHGNTPFEYDEPGVKPVRRLWTQLVNQEELAPIFVHFIFGKNHVKTKSKTFSSFTENCKSTESHCDILSAIKLIHREHDPIVAFAINSVHPGHIVLSTGREIQELNIQKVLEEKDRIHSRPAYSSTFLFSQNRPELDIHMQGIQRDPLRDNDDYQLIVPETDGTINTGAGGRTMAAQTSSYVLNTYIIDRSRLCLQKLRKRPISGIRRLESHQSLPYYISGSSDGSIFLWEWGVEQPIFIARVAGQFAKISKATFAQNGSRFATVDGDGLLCLWLAQPGVPSRKPYFSQKCHNKFTSDVKYVGQTSTLLVTAGHSTGDQNILLWDTLMPASKAIVHSFVGHPDGAHCVAYQTTSQSIISGGKCGEICIWDVRQRQLRHTLKAFDSASSIVKCICMDANGDIIAAGSNEGDIKIWSDTTAIPRQLYSLPTEHASRSGFSLRQVSSISLQGVQQINIDQRLHMYSCGADNSLKIRTIPSLF